MAALSLNDALLERLFAYAKQHNLPIEALLARWLDEPPPPTKNPAHYFQSMLDSQTAYVLRTDLEGVITYSNKSFAKKYGMAVADIVGMLSLDTIAPEDHDKAISAAAHCIEHPDQPILTTLRKSINGEVVFTLWEFAAIQDPSGKVCEIQCIGFDVTQQVAVQQALEESEERYRNVSNLISDYAYGFRVGEDGKTTLEWVTDSFTHVTGYTAEDINYTIPYMRYHDEDQARLAEDIQATVRGESCNGEYRLYTKDGRMIWVRITRSPIKDPITGRVVRFYGAAKDITAEKHAEASQLERERLEVTLRHEQLWNASIQRMMRVLSHEMRLPLTVINTSSGLLAKHYERLTEEQRAERIQTIRTQVKRMAQIIDEVSKVVRGVLTPHAFDPSPVNLVQLCEICLREVRESVGMTHHLIFDTDGQVQQVMADETLISRILINLLANAVKYSPDGSTVRLVLRRDGDDILLSVADQGVGISADDLAHIFDPFFRSEQVELIDGTGLGLSIVRDCVEIHDGAISVESEPGKGSTFTVRLPYVQP